MIEIPGARTAGAVTALVGAGMIARPTTQGAPPAVARVLGVRTVVQAVVQAVRPAPAVVRLAVAADVLHASTMLGAMAIWPRYRRAAATSAVIALTSATAGAIGLRQAVRANGSTR